MSFLLLLLLFLSMLLHFSPFIRFLCELLLLSVIQCNNNDFATTISLMSVNACSFRNVYMYICDDCCFRSSTTHTHTHAQMKSFVIFPPDNFQKVPFSAPFHSHYSFFIFTNPYFHFNTNFLRLYISV